MPLSKYPQCKHDIIISPHHRLGYVRYTELLSLRPYSLITLYIQIFKTGINAYIQECFVTN